MNLNEEERCGFVISEKMKGLWSVQLELLEELKRVCDSLGIKVFASGGTLLGGVRHQGYIPWDDDIDVILFRKDYELLLEKGPELFRNGYFLQSTYSDKILRTHAQLRKNGTTCLTKWDFRAGYHRGVFIDIFIYDKVPCDESERLEFKKALMKKWVRINKPDFVRSSRHNGFLLFAYNASVVLLKRFFWDIANVFCLSREKRIKTFERLCTKYNDSDSPYVSNVSFRGINPKTALLPFRMEWFKNPSTIKFEHLSLYGPSNTDDYLSLQYGNYKKFVVGTSFHGDLFFDISKDYSEYDRLSYQDYLQLFRSDKQS